MRREPLIELGWSGGGGGFWNQYFINDVFLD